MNKQIFMSVFSWLILHLGSYSAEVNNDELLYNLFKNRANTESYVVVIFAAEEDKSISKSSLNLHGTIVGVIKGRKDIGQKIAFNRVSEDKLLVDEHIGSMFVVQYYKSPINDSPISGQFYVEPQAPGAFVKCSKELFRLVNPTRSVEIDGVPNNRH